MLRALVAPLLVLALAACAAAPAPSAPALVAAASFAGPIDQRPDFLALQLPPRAQGARPTCSICTTVVAQ